jgi:FkbM family methyltransferase
MSLSGRLRQAVAGAVYSTYYRARDLNYAYGWSTPKTVGEARFRTYELYNLHGRDTLLHELLQRTEEGDVIYDVGANVGVYTCAVASVGAEAVAFEPNPEPRRKLRENIEANGFDATVLPFAVSDEEGCAVFHVSSYPEVSSLLRPQATVSGGSVVEKIEVETRSLDSLLEQVPEPDHVKIDVEGAGGAVLRGSETLLRKAEPTVYFEPHGREVGRKEAKGILLDAGYSIERDREVWVCTP